ncbi:hypothetical protein [Marisediminicola sp. LYQ134]|uniref:hypothetical protein n=1 Tax=Marisediminicola sp. LYQ134 TaxID=3391061 RepID=UPI003982D86B
MTVDKCDHTDSISVVATIELPIVGSTLRQHLTLLLLVGPIVLGDIPDYPVSICRGFGIVLLTLREDVSIKSVTLYVDSALARSDSQATSRSLAINRLLLESLDPTMTVETIVPESPSPRVPESPSP